MPWLQLHFRFHFKLGKINSVATLTFSQLCRDSVYPNPPSPLCQPGKLESRPVPRYCLTNNVSLTNMPSGTREKTETRSWGLHSKAKWLKCSRNTMPKGKYTGFISSASLRDCKLPLSCFNQVSHLCRYSFTSSKTMVNCKMDRN